jgi:hypothetical protein
MSNARSVGVGANHDTASPQALHLARDAICINRLRRSHLHVLIPGLRTTTKV